MTRVVLASTAIALVVAGCSHSGPAAARRFVDRGDRSAHQGDDKSAAIEYRNAIRESPSLLEAHSRLAEVSTRLHDNATATAELMTLAELQPKDADAQIRAGNAALAVGRLDEARGGFMTALALDPTRADANRGIALIYAATGRAHDAEPYWKAVAAGRGGDPFALADFYISQRRLADAEHELRTAMQVPDQALPARLRLSAVLFESKRPREADAMIDSALRTGHGTAAAWMLRGRMRVAERKLSEAKSDYLNALEAEPQSMEALAALTAIDLAAHRANDAKARVETRLAREPGAVPLLMLAAQTYLSTGDADRAERALERVVGIAPESLDAYSLLGQIYISQGRLDGARAKFETIAARAADPVPAATMVAMILDAQHHRDEAQRQYESILKKSSSAGVAANNLAWIYLDQGRNDDALQYAIEAKSLLRQLPQASDTLGWVHVKMGRAREALPLLAECVDRQPNNPLYHFHLGMAYLAADMPDRAQEQLKEALNSSTAFEGRVEAEQRLAALSASHLQSTRQP